MFEKRMEKNRNEMDESIRFVAQHYQEGAFNTTKGWKRLTPSLPGFGKRGHLSLLTRVAAAALLLLIIGVGVLKMVNQPEQLYAETDNTPFTLPDQTTIVMKQGAKLQYYKHFNKTERHISMYGEITFAVARDEIKPFIVSTPTALIEVLGTEFTVAANDDETRLSVASGKVLFTPNDPTIPLHCTAGMKAHYIAETATINMTAPGRKMEINGKARSLTFDNMELKEVVSLLSQFYKIAIELPENEAELAFSSSFTQESIIEIINIINLTLDTHITIKEPPL